MNPNDLEHKHADMVAVLVKDPKEILLTQTPRSMNLIHAVFGIAGEAGELLDAVKKHVIYNKPLDLVNVEEELGDLEFYMRQIRQELSISREECLKTNMIKLAARYKNFQYTDQQAQERNDKK